jgi:hypothetical protein
MYASLKKNDGALWFHIMKVMLHQDVERYLKSITERWCKKDKKIHKSPLAPRSV